MHLPLELVDNICAYLHGASDIQAVRLVNRAFCNAATKLITDIWHSPSLLFANENISEENTPSSLAATDTTDCARWLPNPITLWTWIGIPSTLRLEDCNGSMGQRFQELIFAPDKPPARSFHHRAFDEYGRKATCWGRIQEDPEMFCIVMRKHTTISSCNTHTESE